MTNQQLWQSVLGNIEVSLSKANFTTWFRNTSIIEKNNDYIVVSVPNSFNKEWLQSKYTTDILKTLRPIAPEVREVRYQVLGTGPSQATVQQGHNNAEQQVKGQGTTRVAPGSTSTIAPNALNNGLSSRYTFDSFIVGKNNELAHAAAVAVSQKPGTIYNPLFLYGGVGLGKTHLMQAIGHKVQENNPGARILYISSERFTNEFVQALGQGRIPQFKDLYRNIDVLMIDDIQFLAGKESTQEEFFHTFNALHQNNKQIILSSDRLPKDIPAIEERLVSRFTWGMIADIQAPDFETRLAILRTKCKEKNYDVNDEVLTYIAEVVQSNIRELEGALNRMIVYCQLNNISPSVDLAKTVLAGVASQKKKFLSPRKIMEAVSDFYNINMDDLLRQSRRKEFVKPRQIAMYLMRTELENSFPSIGDHFNGRDHTTVMHAVDKINRLISEKESMKQEIDLIVNKLYM